MALQAPGSRRQWPHVGRDQLSEDLASLKIDRGVKPPSKELEKTIFVVTRDPAAAERASVHRRLDKGALQ